MKLCVDKILADHCLIQTNSWDKAVFQTTLRSPATFKEELSAPRDNLMTAGWCNISLCLVGSVCLLNGCLYEARSNCEMRSSNGSFKYGRTTIVAGW